MLHGVMGKTVVEKTICIHCGDPCRDDGVTEGDLAFCCHGCQTVYHLLRDNKLDNFYQMFGSTGLSLKGRETPERFEYLSDESVRTKLLDFTDGQISRVTLHVPQMYCSSCIWLLENLPKLKEGVVESRVDFPRRTLTVTYRESALSLRELVELLSRIGYTPRITLQSLEKPSFIRDNKRLVIQTGIAGFAFANIMLFSFPDYLAGEGGIGSSYQKFFGYLSLLLALPVLFYSSVDFFRGAYQGLKVRKIHLDLPLSIGILALFARSLYEVGFQTGSGYFDSFTGLVFFLLVGRVVQSATFQTLAFDRDYKSYFPLSVTIKKDAATKQIPLSRLQLGDIVVTRNGELIAADAVLRSPFAEIDYSFVTGESKPVAQTSGAMLYAGGRIVGAAAEMEVVKEVSQGYLVSLWASRKFAAKQETRSTQISQTVAARFTFAILLVSAATFAFWMRFGIDHAFANTTAVLIVACPCALALSIPFTFGTAMQLFGRRGFYLRDYAVVESIACVDTVVFDKTGTLTTAGSAEISYRGAPLDEEQMGMLKTLAASSTHPLSRRIANWVQTAEPIPASRIEEITGKGVEGYFGAIQVRLGSSRWISANDNITDGSGGATFSIDGRTIGRFELDNVFREATRKIVPELSAHFDLHLISGDSPAKAKDYEGLFVTPDHIHFGQSPHEKLNYVDSLKDCGAKVMMVGDGLNDSGALAAADVGIALTEDVASFSPASDVIMSADSLELLPRCIRMSRTARNIVMASFVISLAYNLAGIYFAVTGQLSPLIAAILMPLSSVSVVGFAVITTRLAARKLEVA